MGLVSYLHLNPFLTAFAVASFVAFVLFIGGTKRPKNSPPGPPTLPIIGNIHQLPLARPFIKFREWARKYGGLYSIKIGPQTVVMISDAKVLRDLYEKRGAIYSSRPHNHIGGDIVCPNETHILFMPSGEGSRNYRHAYNTFMGPQQGEQLRTIQTAEASKLLQKLLLTPERYYEHICCDFAAVILGSHYGIFPDDYEDWAVKEAWRIQREWMKIVALGSTPPIDAFPFLKSLPDFMSPWRARANSFRKTYRKFFYGLLNEGKARIAEGKTIGSFLEKLLQDKESYGLDEEHLMYFSATLVEGGTGTSASSMLSFILACMENNEILKKAQEDVDRVCGTSRFPNINDRDSMPYIRACVNEVLRWRPALPFSVSRQLIKDDHYEDYFFPKGTILFQLTWAMSMDENVYENPEIFNPNRYIQNKFGTKFETSKDEESGRKEQYAFGIGRKACPGERFGRDTLFIIIAKLVWAFNIASPTDPKTGKPMTVNTDIETAYIDGIIIAPSKFPVNFTIRSETHREVVEREVLLAEEIISKIRKEA